MYLFLLRITSVHPDTGARMAWLGRRVEVFWPPEGDDPEGTW